MKSKIILFLLVTTLFFISCERMVMNSKPGTDNLSLFNEYSKICIDKFGLSEVKGINLTELADSIKPYINSDLSKEELFNYMGILTKRMQEGHTNLEAIDEGYFASRWYFLGYPPALKPLLPKQYYYGEEANPDVQVILPEDSFYEILYGFLPQDNEIGYIRIINFTMSVKDSELEEMMKYLKDTKGIIIDVRGNIGGYINLAARLASYFTTEEVIFATNYIKNGPGSDDFAASEMKLAPSGSENTYSKPVAVIQDRVTFSSGSLFAIMMNSLENTTTLGQIFGGGTGEIIDGFLSNGWRYNLSTSNLVDNQGRPTDNGIEADIPMIINPADSTLDAIIERAILELQ